MNKKEIIRAIEEEANRKTGEDPETWFVVAAEVAKKVIEELDIE